MFAYTTKFPLVAKARLTITPNNGSTAIEVERNIYAYTAPKRPATASLVLEGQDTPVKLISSAWRGNKMFYAYFLANERSSYIALEESEFNVFKESIVSIDLLEVVAVKSKPVKTEEQEVDEVLAEIDAEIRAEIAAESRAEQHQEQDALPAAAEDTPPAKLSKRAQRRGLKTVA